MDKSPTNTINRRAVFVGAGVVGAVGALAAATRLPAAEPAPHKTAEAKLDPAGGYQLTDHVRQYYATARI
ncbi:MAG: formate dehydrogenase [Leptothrix sp. (in: Bacteria)]|nr:formate dehydrogenase [Leptothrix sp. (in: b-proteobacteria)]